MQHPSDPDIAVYVDLDGSLLCTDSLQEQLIEILREKPQRLLAAIPALLRGKAHFKTFIANQCPIDARLWPYRKEVLDFIQSRRDSGAPIILATGAPQVIANAVAAHLQIFDRVLATTEDVNLTGSRKAEAILADCGSNQCVYIGNDRVDLPVWQSVAQAVVVSDSGKLVHQAGQVSAVACVIPANQASVWISMRALRVHQWLKNVLVFIPVILSHRWYDELVMLNSTLAFAAFCLCASGVYLANDLFDLPSDRKHPIKKSRPFAAGTLPLSFAAGYIPLFFLVGLGIAAMVGAQTFWAILAYVFITTAYSFKLKKVALVDVFILGLLYSWRILVGSLSAEISISPWLMSFSLMFFLSLALMKRVAELVLMSATEPKTALRGRGYVPSDLQIVSTLGVSASLMSVLILMLYMSSDQVVVLYQYPQMLWPISVILLYWLSRNWLVTHRGQMHHDPLVYSIRDNASLSLIVTAVICYAFATGWG